MSSVEFLIDFGLYPNYYNRLCVFTVLCHRFPLKYYSIRFLVNSSWGAVTQQLVIEICSNRIRRDRIVRRTLLRFVHKNLPPFRRGSRFAPTLPGYARNTARSTCLAVPPAALVLTVLTAGRVEAWIRRAAEPAAQPTNQPPMQAAATIFRRLSGCSAPTITR